MGVEWLWACCLAVVLFALVTLGWGASATPGGAQLSVVVTVRNQQDCIEGILRELCMLNGRWHGLEYEIIVVDNHSDDQTPAVVARLARCLGGLRLVRLAETDASDSPAEVGLFLCRRRVSILVDLEGPVSAREVLRPLRALLGGSAHAGAVENLVSTGKE
ncbi:MAG: glycosyltransferase [Bacillota bacterium]